MITNQQKIAVAKLPNIADVIAIMNDSKTRMGSLIGETDHQTIVNAVTVEVEARLVASFISYLEDIKQNNFHE